jgi:hypothetical protein
VRDSQDVLGADSSLFQVLFSVRSPIADFEKLGTVGIVFKLELKNRYGLILCCGIVTQCAHALN